MLCLAVTGRHDDMFNAARLAAQRCGSLTRSRFPWAVAFFYALFPGTTRRSLPSSSRLMLGRSAQRVTAEVISP